MIVRRGRPTQSVEPCSQPGGHDAGAGTTSIERRVVLSRSSTLYDVRHETAAAADTEAAVA